MLGILTLDTAFPRVPGDVGCARTFDFPVRYATPKGADPSRVVHRRDDSLLPAFVAAAHELIDAGAIAIATTCGFLVRWQREFVAALPVFQSVAKSEPPSRKAADAMLKAGYCQYELKNTDAARETLRALIARHPGSDAAREATLRLERWDAAPPP